MSKTDIEPARGEPLWPMSPEGRKELALASDWGQQSYAGPIGPELNLAALWRILNEWRWLILGAVAVGIAGAIIITLLTQPLYRSTAVLEINPPSVQIMDDASEQPTVSNDYDYLATQYGLLASRSLAQRVAQELNLASNKDFVSGNGDHAAQLKTATGRLMGSFTVEPVENSRLIKISYSSPSPSLAARITNSFADNFIDSNLERRYEASSYARDFLQRQIAKVKTELEKSERDLVAYAQQQQIINTGTGIPGQNNDASSLPGEELVALNQALATAQTARITAEQRYRQSRNVGTTAEVNDSTATLRNQKASMEAEYQQKLTSFKPDYPDMVRMRAQIDALDKQIAAEAGQVSTGRSNSMLADYQASVADERALQARVNQLKGSVLDLRGRTIQYNILQRELDTNRSLYDALLQRYKEIGVAGGIGTNLVSVVDRAQVPGSPYKPNMLFNLLIGFVLGLAGGIAAALALEFINDTIKTPDDVRDKLRLASLGVIPKKRGQDTLAKELEDNASPISEAYFSLRTSLQFATDTGAPKTLLITSTKAAEGKSSTTLALAQNFARLGNSVLLIDADLRKPAFVTGSEAKEGLSKLLTNSEPLEGHILKTHFENLWLVPCGPLPPNPAELLASPRLKALVNEASNHFDLVIVDGPPVLGLADAPLLGAVCRGALLVVESGKTRTKAALEAVNRLNAAGSHIVGAVLTKYSHQNSGYGYNYEPYRYGGVSTRDREIELIAYREG
jgi:succinoglycan biosynthesis transport protein ExoP